MLRVSQRKVVLFAELQQQFLPLACSEHRLSTLVCEYVVYGMLILFLLFQIKRKLL